MKTERQQSVEWWKSRMMFSRFGFDARKNDYLELIQDVLLHFETEDTLSVSQAAEMIKTWLLRDKDAFERRTGDRVNFDDHALLRLATHRAMGETPPLSLLSKFLPIR